MKIKAILDTLRMNCRNSKKRPLPVTDAEANALIDAVIDACGLGRDNNSVRNAIAATMMRVDPDKSTVSVNELKNVVQQARMKQSFYNEIERIRAADAEELKAAANEEAQ